ncbi:MAG: 2-succinyl-5-enolpyruvyl-6-hydroxy-3-cyclohexene-1-carboxylic-acid synthase [Alloprevotella sp.]
MFCNKRNVNLLVAALAQSEVRDIVVCPGSRNAVILHDLFVCNAPKFRLYPVTDERSAAFVAIGVYLAVRKPVAVCLTSGSALLNALPGVAEAAFRQIPLLIISADRPPERIGCLDGQTLPQAGALEPYATSTQLPETADESGDRHCLAALREAFGRLYRNGGAPSHVNVPLTEPLFAFTVPSLPCIPAFQADRPTEQPAIPPEVVRLIREARLPAIVVGHSDDETLESLRRAEATHRLLLLSDICSGGARSSRCMCYDLHPSPEKLPHPDVVLHAGGAFVGKQLKLLLRATPHLRVVRIDPTADLPDTFDHLMLKVKAEPAAFIAQILPLLPENPQVAAAILRLEAEEARMCQTVGNTAEAAHPMRPLLRTVAEEVERIGAERFSIFVANSSVVREVAATAAFHRMSAPLFCNRGTNGIEGSVSVAAGYALASTKTALLLTGDLSFFYDAAGLWDRKLGGNLRIVIFNDGGGGIFHRLPGLSDSPAVDEFICGRNDATAEGIARSYGCRYLQTAPGASFRAAVQWLLAENADCPAVLEVNLRTR